MQVAQGTLMILLQSINMAHLILRRECPESVHHRGWNSGSIWPNTCSSRNTQNRRLLKPFERVDSTDCGQPVPVLCYPQSTEVLLVFSEIILCLILCPLPPVSGHDWKEPGFVLFAPSLQVFLHIAEIFPSLLLSGWTIPGLSYSSHRRDSSVPSVSFWSNVRPF